MKAKVNNGMQSLYDKRPFVHLHVNSEFSFLKGASHVEDLVKTVAANGQRAFAITDMNTLSGVPEFYMRCRKHGIKPILGAELTSEEGNIVVLAKNHRGFASLCKLITHAHMSNARNEPKLSQSYLFETAEDIVFLTGGETGPLANMLRQRDQQRAIEWTRRFKQKLGDDFYIELQRTLEPGQRDLNRSLLQLAKQENVPVVATNGVLYSTTTLAHIQDVLICIQHLITVDTPHKDRQISDQHHLKSSDEMNELFSDIPEAIGNTLHIADKCEEYELGGEEFVPRLSGTPFEKACQLRELTFNGAHKHYSSLPDALIARIQYELGIICSLNFMDYFLIAHDLIQFAKQNNYRYAGRGSAADSFVAYCLDITKVDAFKRNLRFERFINPSRANNLPDIDIDFDARYRDKVSEYVTQKYGTAHVATVCTFSRFRGRSALRDIAKVLGIPESDINIIAKSTHWATSSAKLRRAIEKRPEMRSLSIPEERFGPLLDLCEDISNLPRHLSTHLGGVVITGDPIFHISPLQMAAKGVQVIQYDKEGVEDLNLFKLDLLCLRMLSAVEDSVVDITKTKPEFEYDKIDVDDPYIYELIQRGETVGAFQIESPAQVSLHPRLKTRTYEDVVASVALIRPGPIKGEMVEPFIRRRNNKEKVSFIHPAVERILGHTYGVVLYQEQVVAIAVELAGFSPAQADTLRRTISHNRSLERMQEIGKTFVEQAVRNGVSVDIANEVFSWLEGYAGYGFCEAHAAAFGDTSVRSAHLLNYYPAEFYSALLNNQPMGFYPPATLVNEAKLRGISISGPDIQSSEKPFKGSGKRMEVGLGQVKGITEESVDTIVRQRPFRSWGDYLRRMALSREITENLILCGALESIHPSRKALLYSLGQRYGTKTSSSELSLESEPVIPSVEDYSLYEKVTFEWEILGFSPKYHPLQFWREELHKEGVLPVAKIKSSTDTKRSFRVAGWKIRPHTPPTKSGRTVVFFSLEDETGMINVTVFPDIYEKYGHLIFRNPLLIVEGKLSHRGDRSVIVDRIEVCDFKPSPIV